jgi:8-oxo-dGTP diphosphatase
VFITSVATVSETTGRPPVPQRPPPGKLEAHGAVFFDVEGRLLVVRSTYGSNPWGIPGGMAEPDETPRATVRREVQEEIGIAKEPGALLVVAWQPSRVRNLTEEQRAAGWSDRIEDGIQLVFDGGVLTPDEVAAIKLDPDEMEDFAFLHFDQAVERMAPLHARWVIAAVQARESGSVVYLEYGYPPN